MKAFIRNVAVLVTVAALSACNSAPVKLGQVVDPASVDLTKGRKVSSEASGFQLLLLIPIAINSRQDRAYTQLLAQAGSDLLGDVIITESWTYAFVGTIYTTKIEATAFPKRAN